MKWYLIMSRIASKSAANGPMFELIGYICISWHFPVAWQPTCHHYYNKVVYGHYYCITIIHFTTTVVLVLLSLLLYCCSIIVPPWSSLSRSNPIDVSRQIFHVTFLPIMSSIKQLNTCCFQAITPVKSSILGPITKDYDGILFTIIDHVTLF